MHERYVTARCLYGLAHAGVSGETPRVRLTDRSRGLMQIFAEHTAEGYSKTWEFAKEV